MKCTQRDAHRAPVNNFEYNKKSLDLLAAVRDADEREHGAKWIDDGEALADSHASQMDPFHCSFGAPEILQYIWQAWNRTARTEVMQRMETI